MHPHTKMIMGCLCMIEACFFGITNAVAKGTGNDLLLSEIIFFEVPSPQF